jgi:hypothetical protein
MLSLFCGLWVLVAYIAYIIIVIDVYGIVGFATDLYIHVLVALLLRRRLAP